MLRGKLSVTVCVLLAIGSLVFPWQRLSAAEPKVVWHNAAEDDTGDFAKNKLFVMYFHADWCTWCEKLKQDVFDTPEFQALGDKALFVEVDDKNDAKSNRVMLEKNLEVESYPTVIVLKIEEGKGSVVGRVVGYHPAEEYLGMLRPYLGVKNPEKQKLPDSLAGQGLTPDSNRCRPGDVACIVGQQTTDLSGLGSIDSLLKQEPAPKAAPVEEGRVLDDEGLRSMLEELGYKVTGQPGTNQGQIYRIFQEEDGWTIPADVAISANGEKLWITNAFGALKVDSQLPPEKLIKLLEFNTSYGPCTFAMVEGRLSLTYPLDNVGMTKARLSASLASMRKAVRETIGVWNDLLERPETQAAK